MSNKSRIIYIFSSLLKSAFSSTGSNTSLRTTGELTNCTVKLLLNTALPMTMLNPSRPE